MSLIESYPCFLCDKLFSKYSLREEHEIYCTLQPKGHVFRSARPPQPDSTSRIEELEYKATKAMYEKIVNKSIATSVRQGASSNFNKPNGGRPITRSAHRRWLKE